MEDSGQRQFVACINSLSALSNLAVITTQYTLADNLLWIRSRAGCPARSLDLDLSCARWPSSKIGFSAVDLLPIFNQVHAVRVRGIRIYDRTELTRLLNSAAANLRRLEFAVATPTIRTFLSAQSNGCSDFGWQRNSVSLTP